MIKRNSSASGSSILTKEVTNNLSRRRRKAKITMVKTRKKKRATDIRTFSPLSYSRPLLAVSPGTPKPTSSQQWLITFNRPRRFWSTLWAKHPLRSPSLQLMASCSVCRSTRQSLTFSPQRKPQSSSITYRSSRLSVSTAQVPSGFRAYRCILRATTSSWAPTIRKFCGLIWTCLVKPLTSLSSTTIKPLERWPSTTIASSHCLPVPVTMELSTSSMAWSTMTCCKMLSWSQLKFWRVHTPSHASTQRPRRGRTSLVPWPASGIHNNLGSSQQVRMARSSFGCDQSGKEKR